MPNRKATSPSHVTTGDVFADLGFTPYEAAEARLKTELLRDVLAQVKRENLTSAGIAKRLEIYQPEVSHLKNGRISQFSVSKLIRFAVALHLDVQVKVTKPRATRAAVGRRSSEVRLEKAPKGVASAA